MPCMVFVHVTVTRALLRAFPKRLREWDGRKEGGAMPDCRRMAHPVLVMPTRGALRRVLSSWGDSRVGAGQGRRKRYRKGKSRAEADCGLHNVLGCFVLSLNKPSLRTHHRREALPGEKRFGEKRAPHFPYKVMASGMLPAASM